MGRHCEAVKFAIFYQSERIGYSVILYATIVGRLRLYHRLYSNDTPFPKRTVRETLFQNVEVSATAKFNSVRALIHIFMFRNVRCYSDNSSIGVI